MVRTVKGSEIIELDAERLSKLPLGVVFQAEFIRVGKVQVKDAGGTVTGIKLESLYLVERGMTPEYRR